MANLLSASSMAIFFEKTPLNGANLLRGALFGINPERRVGSMAKLLSASSMAIFFEKTPLNGANSLRGALFGINPERRGW
jgi:hypothetical protein